MELRIANIQMDVSGSKAVNLATAESFIHKAVQEGADFVALPEMFNCPYQTKNFPVYAESEGGETWRKCSELAKRYGVYLSAGTIPEKGEDGKIYNTAFVFDREGKQIAKHRKMHLFDISVEGGQTFKESDTLTPGNSVTVFETEFGKMGLCICYDFRFPELSRLMVNQGAKVIVVPAAFNMTTGPAHWEILFRSRALDNQVFVIGTAPARNEKSVYTSWGHSLVVAPFGNTVQEMDEKEGYIVNSLDLELVDKVRGELPLLAHRRLDLYSVSEL